MKQTTFDFIFVDYNPPHDYGIDCLRRIKQQFHTEHVPVIMYADTTDCEMNKVALSTGAVACVRKPLGETSIEAEILRNIVVRNIPPEYLATDPGDQRLPLPAA